MGVPYDSDQGRGCAGAITALMMRPGLPDQLAHRRRPSGPTPATRPTRSVHRRHAHAPRRHCAASTRARARRRCSKPPNSAWHNARRARRALRLPQRAGHGARSHRHHRLHDGLRHHRHRARPGAGEVQEAGRRRHDQDRQQHRAAGADPARLHAGAGRENRRAHRRAGHRSRARRASSRSTCRSSTAASARPTDRPSTTWATFA